MPDVRLRAGRQWISCNIERTGKTIKIKFPYNKTLLEEIKLFEGRRWVPESKTWTFPAIKRNLVQLQWLAFDPAKDGPEKNPFANYMLDVPDLTVERPLMSHQRDMAAFGLTRKRCIFACEMGTGKTLAAIEVMERSGCLDWWWVGPKAGIMAVDLEFIKWKSKMRPRFMTYEHLVKVMKEWKDGDLAPQGIVFDEAQKVKNPSTIRSVMARALVEGIWEDHGDPYVLLLTGTPAPRDPTDWWNPCEIACPGYIREGSKKLLQRTLSLIEFKDNPITGGRYPNLITWLDNKEKCAVCGQLKSQHNADHVWVESVNEVERFGKRIKPLATIKLKRDCLDLPEKVYHEVVCPPAPSTIRAASLIVRTAKTAAIARIRLRELSDGFQYQDVATGNKIPCSCGNGRIYSETRIFACQECGGTGCSKCIDGMIFEKHDCDKECEECKGTGLVDEIQRLDVQTACPKDEALKDLLDEYEELGRIIIYAGFTASVDRCVRICEENGWSVIRVDGRGWSCPAQITGNPLLAFQQELDKHPKIAIVGHPQSLGVAVTLTAAQATVYFSNSDSGEDRAQSEDRFHRPGCKAANIYDLIHLPTDRLVLNNLRKKIALQALTLGDLQNAFAAGVTTNPFETDSL